jgi:hypothetical protein
MSYKIIVKSGAELDLLEIAKWYESKSEGLEVVFYRTSK